LYYLDFAVAPDSVEPMTTLGTWASTQGLMAVSQATSDQKEKKECWDVAFGKEAKRLTPFLLLFLESAGSRGRHQIESPERAPKESAQGRLPQSITSKYELS
jgi:hypothetical protein